MVFAFLSINNYNVFNDQDGTIEIGDETHLESPKRSGYWTPNFIHIDGSIPNNWSATTGYPWCYVDNGVYIIENVTIDAGSSPTGNGIFINNSKNEYFIIRNCTVYNAGSGADEAGIKMENTNNGMVVKNNCSNKSRLI